jgi:hypothetical protein
MMKILKEVLGLFTKRTKSPPLDIPSLILFNGCLSIKSAKEGMHRNLFPVELARTMFGKEHLEIAGILAHCLCLLQGMSF